MNAYLHLTGIENSDIIIAVIIDITDAYIGCIIAGRNPIRGHRLSR